MAQPWKKLQIILRKGWEWMCDIKKETKEEITST